MPQPAPAPDDLAFEDRIHPGMPGYVATEEEFLAAVQKGIESAEAGPCRDMETVSAEIRRLLLAS